MNPTNPAAASPALNVPPSPSLYIGDLAPEVTQATLNEIFSAVGPVANTRVCRDSVTRRSLGYGYVNFHRLEDAERALDTMNYKKIMGRACRIMWSHRDPTLRRSGTGNVFVKNLDTSIDSKMLNDTFSMFGNILSCKVSTDKATGESLGYGFVHYESDEAAAKAIEKVNGKKILTQIVKVELYKPKAERSNNEQKFTNVYVKNLPKDFTQEQLNELFGKYGEITSSLLRKKTATVRTLTKEEGKEGESAPAAETEELCFAFVNFKEPAQAQAALDALTDYELGDKKLYVSRAMKKEERRKELSERHAAVKAEKQRTYAGVNLYVKNFADDFDDDKFRELFSEFGTITSSQIQRDETGKSRGYGFVCFSGTDEATKAVTRMHNKMIEGKPLYVALHQSKAERKQQLDAFHASQRKMGLGPQNMGYPQQGGPMYSNVPRMVFPQQMPWPGQMMNQMGRPMNYHLMPMNGQRGPPRRNGGGMRTDPRRMPMDRSGRQGGNVMQPMGGMSQMGGQQPAPRQQGVGELDIKKLAKLNDTERTQVIGEKLFPLVKAIEPTQAGKITGMLLEMESNELLMLLDSDEALKEKVNEALEVLAQHTAAQQ